MRKKKIVQLASVFLVIGLTISSVYGAFLTYKAYVEIYGEKYPLGMVEIDVKKMKPIEGLEAREDYIGEIRVWTYSNDTELILQLLQVSHIVNNFRSFTVKVCMPLDVIFVVDEGNMELYMATVKEQLTYLVDMLPLMNKMPVRFGVVGFRDSLGETRLLTSLTDDYTAVKTFIADLTATPGGSPPQSHYLGLQAALDDFEANSAIATDKLVIFVTDAPAGKNDLPSFDEAKTVADALAERGIKIHAVLCGPDEYPENAQLKYYAHVSVGNYIGPQGQNRIVAGSTSNPTWIVKLTPITPFDSFRFKLNSSAPCEQEGFYTLSIYVDFFASAIPWHDFFLVELAAHLEKAEIPPPVTIPVNQPLTHSMTVVSDTDTLVTAGNVEGATYPDNAVYAWEPFADTDPSYWDQNIDYDFSTSGADWIWESYRVVHPVEGDIVHFERTFEIAGRPIEGTLHITCDNGYEVYVNGEFVGSAQLEDGWRTSDLTEDFVHSSDWPTVEHYDISDLLLPGDNTLLVIAVNEYMGPLDGQPEGILDFNPGGLIFEVYITFVPD